MNPAPDSHPASEDPIRPHVFDGIQEYDKRMPNWWLVTLYATMVFWVGYWFYYERAHLGLDGPARVAQELSRIETAKLAAMANTKLDDASLWQMSRNPQFVQSGKAIFDANCASCHLSSLRGKHETPTAVGVDLVDQQWLHGGQPLQIADTVTKGVLTKGMPPWGPVLGTKKITEAVAYILSHHREGEPIEIDSGPPTAP